MIATKADKFKGSKFDVSETGNDIGRGNSAIIGNLVHSKLSRSAGEQLTGIVSGGSFPGPDSSQIDGIDLNMSSNILIFLVPVVNRVSIHIHDVQRQSIGWLSCAGGSG